MTSGGWRFVHPVEGGVAWVKALSEFAQFLDGQWSVGSVRGSRLLIEGTQVVGAQAAAIADPSGGTTVATEARDAMALLLNALRAHGLIASV